VYIKLGLVFLVYLIFSGRHRLHRLGVERKSEKVLKRNK
jgi:hypothetical protein